ncbi:MAG: hypothetical protein QOC92_3887 [Acidimicrobiaceae bacterium]|jgi:hypothetical protein
MAHSVADVGLELFIMERQVVLHEEAEALRRRRRWLRATGFAVLLSALGSGTGLAAARTGPVPAAESAIDFLFPGDPPPPDELPPIPVAALRATETATVTARDAAASSGSAVAPAHVIPANAPPSVPPTASTPGNSGDAPGHATARNGAAPGNSGDHGNPSPPGQSKDPGNPHPPGQVKKADAS